MTTTTRPNFQLCKTRTKRHGLALPHVMPKPGEKVSPFRTTTECVECHVDPILAAAAFDCRCRLKRTHDGETCACGIVWHHQDNGPTRAIRLTWRGKPWPCPATKPRSIEDYLEADGLRRQAELQEPADLCAEVDAEWAADECDCGAVTTAERAVSDRGEQQ